MSFALKEKSGLSDEKFKAQFGIIGSSDYFLGPGVKPLGTNKETAQGLVNAFIEHYAGDEGKQDVIVWLRQYMDDDDFMKRITDLLTARTDVDCFSLGDCWINNVMLR